MAEKDKQPKVSSIEASMLSRKEYSELVLMLINGASFPGAEAENVTMLKRITSELANADPWSTA